MILSTFQSEIIDNIVDENITDIQSFVAKYFVYATQGQDNHILVFKNESDKQKVINKTIEFYKLVNMLIKNELIILLDKPNPESKRLEFFFGDPMRYDYRINQMISKLADKFFISSLGLIEFKDRGYRTLEEKAYEEEKKDRKNAQRITVAIALFTITINTVLIVFYGNNNQSRNTNSIKFANKTSVDTSKIKRNSNLMDTLNSKK